MDGPLLLDSYAAKACTYALHLDRVAPVPDRLGRSEAAEARIQAGMVFEVRVGEALRSLDVEMVVIPPNRERDADRAGWEEDRTARLDWTSETMRNGAPMIWNPRLRPDPTAHRAGEPDLLVRAEAVGLPTYFPVDVKAHHALAREVRGSGGTLAALVDRHGPAIVEVGAVGAAHADDLLQLAHYWRMLESIGFAPAGPPHGAIIGWSGSVAAEPIVGWFDLTEMIDGYDGVFAEALSVVERADAIARGALLPPIGRPWYGTRCHDCDWRGVCGPELLAAHHVSLVRPNWRIRPAIEALELRTFDALAEYDVDLAGPEEPDSALWRDAVARARMAQAGDPPPFALVPEVGGEPHLVPRLWRREDAPERWPLSRRDVELDVDMESVPSGTYLWGTLLSYADGGAPFENLPAGYRGFGKRFTEPGDTTAAAVFAEFMDFLGAVRRACHASGRTFGAYCYSGPSAEEPAMKRGAELLASAGGPDMSGVVEQLVASSEWIDLLDEIRGQLRSLNGLGLKIVAGATGFAWRAKDASGEASMRWHERAVAHPDPDVRAANRSKILEYNEDDVSATRHLRQWFSEHGPDSLPLVP